MTCMTITLCLLFTLKFSGITIIASAYVAQRLYVFLCHLQALVANLTLKNGYYLTINPIEERSCWRSYEPAVSNFIQKAFHKDTQSKALRQFCHFFKELTSIAFIILIRSRPTVQHMLASHLEILCLQGFQKNAYHHYSETISASEMLCAYIFFDPCNVSADIPL